MTALVYIVDRDVVRVEVFGRLRKQIRLLLLMIFFLLGVLRIPGCIKTWLGHDWRQMRC